MSGFCTTVDKSSAELAVNQATVDNAKVLVNDIRAKLKGSYVVSKPALATDGQTHLEAIGAAVA